MEAPAQRSPAPSPCLEERAPAWLSSRGARHTPRGGAERGAKGVSEEGLGGPCGQGRPCLSGARGGRQDEPARRVPCSPSWPGLLTGCLGSPGEPLLWLIRDWGRDGTQERQEAEESTEPLGLASPEQSAGPPLTTHPLRDTQGPSVSFQGSCWPSQPRFPTPAPSSRSAHPSCLRVARCGAFELCSYHQRQPCFHISSPSSWDRSAGLLGQL